MQKQSYEELEKKYAELEAATFRADNAERELSRAASQNADLRAKIKEMQGEAVLQHTRYPLSVGLGMFTALAIRSGHRI